MERDGKSEMFVQKAFHCTAAIHSKYDYGVQCVEDEKEGI